MNFSSKPKIAILTIKNSYDHGGVFACLKQVHKFCDKYFQPTVFCLDFDKNISANLKSLKFSSQVKYEKLDGMDYVNVGARWAFWEPGHYIFTLPVWKKVLKDYDYFFVISGNCIPAYPLIKLNKKFVMWTASPYLDDREQRLKEMTRVRALLNKLVTFKMLKVEKTILRKADFVFALCKYVKKRFDQILSEQRDNMVICNYPIKCDIKNDKKKVGKFVKDVSEKRIIAVGRFADPRKNIQMLLRVFDKIYQGACNAKLYVVGSKPSEQLLDKFSDNQSFKNIVFTGSASNLELSELYSTADLMLITSHQEGLGIIGLEAFCHSVPVVATDCGGTRDFVVDGKNGYLVKIDDDNDMAEKALKILNSKDLLENMGRFALDLVQQHFSEKKIFSLFKVGILRVYPELQTLFNRMDILDKAIILDENTEELSI